MMIEVELLLDWYVPAVFGKPATPAQRARFTAAWNAAFDRLEDKEHGFVHRDFQSPNIIWRADRKGHDRLGIVDFQDALIGPTAYDVASIALDARVTISPELEAGGRRRLIAAREKRARLRPRARSTRLMRSWRRSAIPRSSAFSCDSTGATANRTISDICRVSATTFGG